MRSSKSRWTFTSQISASLIGLLMAFGNAPGALAEDDWRRDGLEGLRPAKTSEPFVAFLNTQQAETAEIAEPTETPEDVTAQPDVNLQPDPSPAPLESYNDWLDEGDYKGVPRVRDGRFDVPDLLAPSIATNTIGNGRTPRGFRSDDPSPPQPLPETSEYRGTVSWTPALWAAANTYSNPRYFEERMLERHGHERCPQLTPLISGSRFFATIAILPYLSVVSHPCDHESTLGFYRSGSAAPALLQRPPWDRKAALVETAAIAGMILAFP